MKAEKLKSKSNNYSKLTELSCKYIKEMGKHPYIGEMLYRNFNLLSKVGRADFKLYWRIYRKWTITHLHWFILDTLRKLFKRRLNENNLDSIR